MNRKIAVFHNFLDNIGGAEIVTLTLAKELQADVYTTNIDKEKIIKMGFEDVLPKIYSIGKVPINPPFKQQFSLWKFRKLNLKNKYDFYIICGDWAISGAVKNKPNLWYAHSPIREIWDLQEYTKNNIVPPYQRPIFDLWVSYNRHLNKKYVNSADIISCNSENTRNRLKKFLDKDAVVINPPVLTDDFYYNKNGGFWLSVNRLLANKRIELQLKAFTKMPGEKLIIVGSYEQSRHFKKYANHCQKIKPANVEIKSWVSRKELIGLYADCKGFITTSRDEDFGMNVIEAMAAGKPAIAPDEGGYKETIINGKTGALINQINEGKLINEIQKLGREIDKNPLKFKKACQEQAKNFDTKIFIEKINNLTNGK
jgi:glycosyltransferase involved in cell wall biosynthesis